MEIIRLPLEGTSNTRDIGGYVGANERAFRWKKVLRSDDLSRLTEKDKDYLVSRYHLKKVIDLRTPQEIKSAPNSFANDERVIYVNISLADDVDPNNQMNFANMNANFFGEFYFNLLESKKENVKKVLAEIIHMGEDESVIFHCTAGKDRTGVTAMLLLGICGVSKQDITTNYIQTATNLKYNATFIEGMKKMSEHYKMVFNEDILKMMSGSNEEYIEYAYDKLIEKYGSFKEYFLHIGITEEEITKLQTNYTEEFQ